MGEAEAGLQIKKREKTTEPSSHALSFSVNEANGYLTYLVVSHFFVGLILRRFRSLSGRENRVTFWLEDSLELKQMKNFLL